MKKWTREDAYARMTQMMMGSLDPEMVSYDYLVMMNHELHKMLLKVNEAMWRLPKDEIDLEEDEE